ncbi:MAG: hypothetical protein ABR968_03510 [Bacteroidales bacterium]
MKNKYFSPNLKEYFPMVRVEGQRFERLPQECWRTPPNSWEGSWERPSDSGEISLNS